MITIYDLQGVRHDKCPRCKSKWNYCDDFMGLGVVCSKECGMQSSDYGVEHQLELVDAHFVVNWTENNCLVYMSSDNQGVYFPSLPFDITYERLKELLTWL
jgi:hypothetical protein